MVHDVIVGAATVTVCTPTTPSTVACTSCAPLDSAVITPVALTAIIEPRDDQNTGRPVTRPPDESRAMAAAVMESPIAMDALGTVTLTDATDDTTRIVNVSRVPLLPLAKIIADPMARPVTVPLEFTEAMLGLLLDHLMVRLRRSRLPTCRVKRSPM